MKRTYENELQTEIYFLLHEVDYLQAEISKAREYGDTDEYTRLFRVFLPVQKQYLKLCAEQEMREQENGLDPLAEFNTAS